MPRPIPGDSVPGRILFLLTERHPITLKQVALALGLREDVVRREARKLASQKLVTLEPLGDETYVALTGEGFTFMGLPAKDVENMRARRPPPPKPRDDHDPAFG